MFSSIVDYSVQEPTCSKLSLEILLLLLFNELRTTVVSRLLSLLYFEGWFLDGALVVSRVIKLTSKRTEMNVADIEAVLCSSVFWLDLGTKFLESFNSRCHVGTSKDVVSCLQVDVSSFLAKNGLGRLIRVVKVLVYVGILRSEGVFEAPQIMVNGRLRIRDGFRGCWLHKRLEVVVLIVSYTLVFSVLIPELYDFFHFL